MKNLLDILVNEGILDDLEDNLAEGDKMIEEDIIKSWFTNDRCKMWKQKKGWVLSGNFKMMYDESTYTGPKIKKVVGNFSIFNSGLTTLENIFTEDCVIEGTLTIEDNKNLVSLKGLPANLNSVTICGNKKLKEIDTLINANGNVYVSKNGKKFSKEELSTRINTTKNIFCSVDPYEILVEAESLMEAFKAPQLKVIWDTIKLASKDTPSSERVEMTDIIRIPWDKIDASNISEIDVKNPNCARTIRLYTSYKLDGLVISLNKDGEPLRMLYGKTLIKVHPDLIKYHNRWSSKYLSKYDIGSTNSRNVADIIEVLTNEFYNIKGDDHKNLRPESVMFIEITNKHRQDWVEIKTKRKNAKQGAIALQRGDERTGKYDSTGTSANPWYKNSGIDTKTIRYYQQIADENRKRYNIALTKIRAEREAKSNNIILNLKSRIDKAFQRYTTLLDKYFKDPQNFKRDASIDIQRLHARFFRSGYNSLRKDGLFPMIESYANLLSSSTQKVSDNLNIQTKLKAIANNIDSELSHIENILTQMERI